MSSLNAASPLPLYHQLAELLRAGIRAGEYPPGERIPSEPELAKRHSIGRPTVRQATDLLVQRGLVERRRGSGTYVVEAPEEVDLFSLAGTLASFEKKGIRGRPALVQRLRCEDIPADAPGPFAGRTAWTFTRVTRVGGDPVLLEEIQLDPERFPGLDRYSLAGRSLAQLVDEHYHLRPTGADQAFRVVPVEGEDARLLDLPEGEPILLVHRRLHFPDAEDAIFAALWCRTDRLAFSQTLTAPLP